MRKRSTTTYYIGIPTTYVYVLYQKFLTYNGSGATAQYALLYPTVALYEMSAWLGICK